MNTAVFIAAILVLLFTPKARGQEPLLDIQFFGDTFLAWHSIAETKTTSTEPAMFAGVQPLLDRATINVINFEGVATGTRFPYIHDKTFHLLMPLWTGKILSHANVHVATLANNHTMDFGYAGLFDTVASLNDAGIQLVGAGKNQEEAVKPAIIETKYGNVCLLSFSRTQPYEFYARGSRAGAANLSFTRTLETIRDCSKKNAFTFVAYHWGEELTAVPKDYQQKLARLSIDNGASAVIGHHPHILQSIEYYKSKPIIYSLGNFVFGTRTRSKQQGMAAGFKLDENKVLYTDLVPINVQNSHVNYIPRLYSLKANDRLAPLIPKNSPCKIFPLNLEEDKLMASTNENELGQNLAHENFQRYRCTATEN